MKFDILTLLPGFFSSALSYGVIGRAIKNRTISVQTHDIREYTTDRHRTVDDALYGGGAGMLMKPEPVATALRAVLKKRVDRDGTGTVSIKEPAATVILLTPQGEPLNQKRVSELSKKDRLVILCGRYEGVDERIRAMVDIEISTGDYILTGGEAAALILIDSVGRLVPGVLGSAVSSEQDSFSDGLLEAPQYTRPEVFEGKNVPKVLLSGNHKEIKRWRRTESLRRTFERRPELLEKLDLNTQEMKFINELRKQVTPETPDKAE